MIFFTNTLTEYVKKLPVVGEVPSFAGVFYFQLFY